MMKILKYFLFVMWVLWFFLIQNNVSAAVGVPPSFENNFTKYLTSWEPDREWRVESVYDLWIDSNMSLKDNIRCLFYPNTSLVAWCNTTVAGWKIWDVARYIWFAVLVIFLVVVWINLLLNWWDPEKVKT